jgi:hypothetical protein
VLLVIAAVAGIVAALANIILAATGEKSWGEAALSVVFAALGCIGVGGALRALGGLAKVGLKAGASTALKKTATSLGKAAKRETQTGDQVAKWIEDVNPKHTGAFDDPYSVNCGKCAESVFNKFKGNGEVVAAGEGTYSTPAMQRITGVDQVPMSPSEIEKALVDSGPGSHAVIGVDWVDGGGHWYNAYFDGQKVWAVDGQVATVSPWPGVDLTAVKNWDAGIIKP